MYQEDQAMASEQLAALGRAETYGAGRALATSVAVLNPEARIYSTWGCVMVSYINFSYIRM